MKGKRNFSHFLDDVRECEQTSDGDLSHTLHYRKYKGVVKIRADRRGGFSVSDTLKVLIWF